MLIKKVSGKLFNDQSKRFNGRTFPLCDEMMGVHCIGLDGVKRYYILGFSMDEFASVMFQTELSLSRMIAAIDTFMRRAHRAGKHGVVSVTRDRIDALASFLDAAGPAASMN